MVFDERAQGRVRMMPLDVSGPEEIRARLRSYLAVLGVPSDLADVWVKKAAEGASHGGQAFLKLQDCMSDALVAQAPGVEDASDGAALWRLSVWLSADACSLATLPLSPPLTRQSMASERLKP